MKIGVMNSPSRCLYKEIEAIGKAKYDFVDLTIEEPLLELDVERVKALLEQHNLSLVGHTDPCLPFAYPIDAVREACLKELERCAKVFSALGVKVMNIHPCYASPPSMKRDLLRLNMEALEPIAHMAGRYGLTLVLENFKAPFDRVSNFEKIFAGIPSLKLHLDFGHTNIGKDSAGKFCKHLGHAIKHVHFSDNRTTDDHHMPLGVGSIRWEHAVTALKKTGYDGTITLEVFCDDPSVSFSYLEISRRLLLELWNR